MIRGVREGQALKVDGFIYPAQAIGCEADSASAPLQSGPSALQNEHPPLESPSCAMPPSRTLVATAI